jgi:hypothetical protein
MIKEYQVTLTCESGKYRPVSTIVKNEEVCLLDKVAKKTIINKGIQKICIQHYWGSRDLKAYGYTKARVREYDKEKIEKENKERYEKIKEENYAKGIWKRPKEK